MLGSMRRSELEADDARERGRPAESDAAADIYEGEWRSATPGEVGSYRAVADKLRSKERLRAHEPRDVFLIVQDALAAIIHPSEIKVRSDAELSAVKVKIVLAVESLQFEIERIERQEEARQT